MKIKTYYRPSQTENPYSEPQVKEFDYLIDPRPGDEVIINGRCYEITHIINNGDKIIHDMDKKEISVILKI